MGLIYWNWNFLGLKCLKDLKIAGYTGQRFIEFCGKSKNLFTSVRVFNLSLSKNIANTKKNIKSTHRAFHGLGRAKFAHAGLILG